MPLKLRFAFLISLLSLFLIPGNALAQEEKIPLFSSTLSINNDGSLQVQEKITYDFGPLQRHGIFRNIQVIFKNQDGEKHKTPIKILKVADGNGQPYNYTQELKGDSLNLKIGDPDATITGINRFVITYELRGAIENYSDHDELYFNVTGNEWEVPIDNVFVNVSVPKLNKNESLTYECYTGGLGSKQKDCEAKVAFMKLFVNGGEEEGPALVSFGTLKRLSPGEGMTIVVGFEPGIVVSLPKEKITDFSWVFKILAFLWYVLLPSMILFIYLRFGRDPKVNTAIPVLFGPPEDSGRRITPAEAGTIVDESADNDDITATIVDLAVRGHLKIKEDTEKDLWDKVGLGGISTKNYILEKSDAYITKDKLPLETHEKNLLGDLFGGGVSVKTKDLKDSFAKDASDFKELLYKSVVKNGFFPHNPNSIRTFWAVAGVFCLFTVNFPLGIMCLLFAKAMPRKTLKGARTQVDILGLKRFLTSQERQLTFQEENLYLFEKLLPYSIAFKVTEVWAKRFEHLQNVQPDWYSGSGGFNSLVFASNMNTLGGSVAHAATPTRSSSGFSSGGGGGGFSGGGSSGGGGGGSW